MNTTSVLLVTIIAGTMISAPMTQAASPEIENIAMVPRLTISSDVGVNYAIIYADALATNQWYIMTNVVVTNSPYVVVDLTAPATKRFYRAVTIPPGMALIPAGPFRMGDLVDGSFMVPVHSVHVSVFYMDKYEVTKKLWDEVKNWAIVHGYSFDLAGSGKTDDHPVQSITWYDIVKWCNARSEKEGRVPAYYTEAAKFVVYRTGQVDVENEWVKWNAGYRLPTEAEWEKAARGGIEGLRFPWGNTISWSQANYKCYWGLGTPYYPYDMSPTEGFNPNYNDGVQPYTSPVGSFAPNGYDLYDMVGNVAEWCWDRDAMYSSDPQIDPHGPSFSDTRIIRGGGWSTYAATCRADGRDTCWPYVWLNNLGFRSVLPLGQ